MINDKHLFDSNVLANLQEFSASNNKLMELPIQLFMKQDKTLRQHKLKQIILNDNLIRIVPINIGLLTGLKLLHLHKNPILELPVSMENLWPQLDEFSLDWFSYLLPFVGRIIKSGFLFG